MISHVLAHEPSVCMGDVTKNDYGWFKMEKRQVYIQ